MANPRAVLEFERQLFELIVENFPITRVYNQYLEPKAAMGPDIRNFLECITEVQDIGSRLPFSPERLRGYTAFLDMYKQIFLDMQFAGFSPPGYRNEQAEYEIFQNVQPEGFRKPFNLKIPDITPAFLLDDFANLMGKIIESIMGTPVFRAELGKTNWEGRMKHFVEQVVKSGIPECAENLRKALPKLEVAY